MKKISYSFLVFGFLCMLSCGEDEDPVIVIPPEVITTLTYTLTPSGGGDDVVMSFQDLDGDGGNAPVITSGTLSANTTYSGRLILLNESEDPSEDITEEILEEAEEHQFFFESTLSGLSVSYTDSDANNQPLGLTSSLVTGDPGDGTLTITLRHEPDKSANGVSEGTIDNAGGETDIEVSFDIRVE